MDNDYVVIVDGDLYHHGIIGMKWGRRRYQNKDGSLTAAGKKRYAAEMEKVQAETKKIKAEQRTKARTAAKLSKLEQAKQELKELKTGKKAETPETPEELKARIRKNPNPEDVYKHRNLFTDKEIQDLSLRFTNEASIKKNIPEKIDPRREKINDIVEKIGYVTDKAVVVTKGYNMVANVLNAFGVTDLPKISTDIDGKGKDNKSKDKNKDNDNDNDNQNNSGGKSKDKNKGGNNQNNNQNKNNDDSDKDTSSSTKTKTKSAWTQEKEAFQAEADRNAERIVGWFTRDKNTTSSGEKTVNTLLDKNGGKIVDVDASSGSVISGYRTSGSSYVNANKNKRISVMRDNTDRRDDD